MGGQSLDLQGGGIEYIGSKKVHTLLNTLSFRGFPPDFFPFAHVCH